jgi:hypothetical protein
MDNDIDRLLAEHSNGRWVTESQEDYIFHLQDEVKRLTAENKQLTTDLVALRAKSIIIEFTGKMPARKFPDEDTK